MNKKGFTIVELLASFVLSMIIVILMFQLIINLKDVYLSSGIKSELMNRQNIMTNKIYSDLMDKKVSFINDCGVNCVGLEFDDGSASELKVDVDDGYLTYDDYTIKLGSSYFGTISVDTLDTGFVTGYNSLLSIDIPIYNKLFKDENFGINIVYPYNRSEVAISDIDTENGYVSDGLIVRLDAINNTGSGHSASVSTWTDLSGNGNDATLYNSPTWSNNSIIFDGKTNYGLIENTANMEFPNGTTWEVRVKVLSFIGHNIRGSVELFGNWESAGGGIHFDSEKYFYTNLYNNGDYVSTKSDRERNINQYYTVTLTTNAFDSYLYINGQLINTNTFSEMGYVSSGVPFGICINYNLDGNLTNYANAEFQSVRIYDRALTDEEVYQNYRIDNFRY